MKLFIHLVGCRNPYIIRKNGVHGSPESGAGPLFWDPHSGGLTSRVHTRVRSSRSNDSDGCGTQPGRRRLENTLNRSLIRLSLPAGKPRAIVVQHQLHGTRQHRVKLPGAKRHCKERNPLEMIDFRVSAGQCGSSFPRAVVPS